MFNRSPKTPPNQVKGANPNSPERPNTSSKAPSAISKISAFAKSTALLAALSAPPAISHAQEPVPGPNQSHKVSLGVAGQDTSNNGKAVFKYHINGSFVVPSIDLGDSTGYPYNSIFGLNSHLAGRINPDGWGIGGIIAQEMNYFQLDEVDLVNFDADFHQIASTALTIHYKWFHVGAGVHMQDLLRFDPFAKELFKDLIFIAGADTDLISLRIQAATALAKSDTPDLLTASANFHITPDFSIGLNYRYADSLLAAFANQEQQAYAHSFGGMLTYRIGSHTQPVSSIVGIGGRYEDQSLGTGLDISHVFSINHDAQKPTELPAPAADADNTVVRASVDTTCQDKTAINITSDTDELNKLESLLKCNRVITITANLTQLIQIVEKAKGRINYKLSLYNSENKSGQQLANILSQIPNVGEIILNFNLDPFAKFLVLANEELTHLHGNPKVRLTTAERYFISQPFNSSLSEQKHYFDPTKYPYFDGKHLHYKSSGTLKAAESMILNGTAYKVTYDSRKQSYFLSKPTGSIKHSVFQFSTPYTGNLDHHSDDHGRSSIPNMLESALELFKPVLDKQKTVIIHHHGTVAIKGFTQKTLSQPARQAMNTQSLTSTQGKLLIQKATTFTVKFIENSSKRIKAKFTFVTDHSTRGAFFTITWKKKQR